MTTTRWINKFSMANLFISSRNKHLRLSTSTSTVCLKDFAVNKAKLKKHVLTCGFPIKAREENTFSQMFQLPPRLTHYLIIQSWQVYKWLFIRIRWLLWFFRARKSVEKVSKDNQICLKWCKTSRNWKNTVWHLWFLFF